MSMRTRTSPTRGSLRVLKVGIAVVVTYTACVLAEPPNADLPNWQGACYNCYNYALHSKRVFFAQPGGNAGSPPTCASASAAAVSDGLVMLDWTPGDPEPTCPAGFCLVALSIRKANPPFWGPDYHWYRKNADGTWSQKRGQTPAITTHVGVGPHPRPLTDPSDAAQRGSYAQFCGYFCVPVDPQDLDRIHGFANWGPLAFTARKSVHKSSGLPTPTIPLDPLEPLPFLPSMTLPLPDPGPPPDPCHGYVLEAGAMTPIPFPYYRVKDGIVAVYGDYEGGSISYFEDDNGLEDFLKQGLGPCRTCDDDHPCNCPADTDGDGIVGGPDLVNVILGWGSEGNLIPGIFPDVDGDGIVGGPDLVAVILGWGPCSPAGHPACGPGAGDCFSPNGSPGCDDPECCTLICSLDPFCCDVEWDSVCANEALANCVTVP